MVRKYSYKALEAMMFDAWEDGQEGMKWWNGLTEADRAFWLRAALTAVPAEAWAYYKGCREPSPADDSNGQV